MAYKPSAKISGIWGRQYNISPLMTQMNAENEVTEKHEMLNHQRKSAVSAGDIFHRYCRLTQKIALLKSGIEHYEQAP